MADRCGRITALERAAALEMADFEALMVVVLVMLVKLNKDVIWFGKAMRMEIEAAMQAKTRASRDIK